MQIALLLLIIILSIVLYKLLSSRKVTYPYVRTTRLSRTEDDSEYMTTEAEHGLITIDNDTLIVDGEEYALKAKKGFLPEAYLNITGEKLVSVSIRLDDGEKFYYIDPEHNVYSKNIPSSYSNSTTAPYMVSF